MAIKYICDNCGKETKRNYVSERFEFKAGKNTFQIVIATDETWNAGEICIACLKKAVDEEFSKLTKNRKGV